MELVRFLSEATREAIGPVLGVFFKGQKKRFCWKINYACQRHNSDSAVKTRKDLRQAKCHLCCGRRELSDCSDNGSRCCCFDCSHRANECKE